MKAMNVAMVSGILYVLYVLHRSIADEFMASLVVIFTATSHGILFYSQSIMTEIPYLFFSLLALFYLQKYSTQPSWNGRALALGVALIPLAYLTRLVGLSLLVATVAYLLFESPGTPRDRVRRALTIGSLAAIPALFWFLRTWWVAETSVPTYWTQYVGRVHGSQSVSETVIILVDRIYVNVSKYVLHSARILFFHSPWASWVSHTVLPLLLASLIFGGFVRCVVRKRTLIEYYVLFYMCFVILFPGTRPQRYLVPLIPFIWYYFFVATGHLLRWVRNHALVLGPGYQRGAVVTAKLLLVLLLISNAATAVLANVVYRGKDGYYHVVGEDGYLSMVPWVKAHTSPDSVFSWVKPSLRFLWTERVASYVDPNRRKEHLSQSIREGKIDYVVIDSFSEEPQQYRRQVIENHPDHFRLVYKDDVSEVYRVVKPRFNSQPPLSDR
jgi:hypothetical protein